MKTTKQDPQLETELQELYILSKHWTSDINFAEDEIRILKDILKKHLISVDNLQSDEVKAFYNVLDLQDAAILDAKRKVSEFLQFIRPFVTGSENEIEISLIEKFALLNTDIENLLDAVKQVKKSLYFFAETVMKTELTAFLSQL